MERDRPNIDTVREILHEEDDRVREQPAPLEPQEDETGREDEAES